MARKTRAEQHSITLQKITAAARWRDDMGYDQLWRRMVDLYRGKHWPNTTVSNEDLIAVNLAFSTVNVIAPAVSVNHPKIVVTPNQPEDEDRAAFVEAVVNHLWRHHDFRKPFRRSVKDFLIFGHGWLKVGWNFVEQERTLSDMERDEMFVDAVGETDMFAMENPVMAGDLPTDEQMAASIPDTAMMVVEDQPFIERVSPYDIYIDPEATCLEDAQWICQRIIRPLEEAKKDKRYKASARKNLGADSVLNPMFTPTDREQQDQYLQDIVDRTVIFEFYDIVNNKMSVLAQNGEEFLVDPIPMPYAYGQPFVMLRNYDVPDYFYPMGDLEAIESLQEELDKTRSQLVNARKRYARKYLFHERSFGPEGREALEADDDGRLVPVVDENKSLNEVVIPMPQTPLSPEIYNYSAIIEQDINTVSGVSEYARGSMPEIRRTATEASIIADAQNARAADKLAIIEIGIGHLARRVIQLMQQFMTGEQMAQVADRGGENLFVPFERDDIIGEYDFSVEGGSTQPMNETIRKQQAVSLMNAVAPLVGVVIDPAALAKYVLQTGFGVKNPDKFLIQQGQQTPQDAEAAQTESGGVLNPFGGAQAPLPPSPDLGAFAPTGGVPPELLAQLQGQMGMDLPAL
jgi:hypothetical protein|tara:strand:- start:989 stop:2881 length:1893 start_codon:yes stop_codon:yes gene_type:complete